MKNGTIYTLPGVYTGQITARVDIPVRIIEAPEYWPGDRVIFKESKTIGHVLGITHISDKGERRTEYRIGFKDGTENKFTHHPWMNGEMCFTKYENSVDFILRD